MHIRIARPVLGDFDRPLGNEVAKLCPVTGETIWATPEDELEKYQESMLASDEPAMQISMFAAHYYDISPDDAGFGIFQRLIDIEDDMIANDPELFEMLCTDEDYCFRSKVAKLIINRAKKENIL
jgi:hypothetical protein